MSADCTHCGAVIASREGWFAWWESLCAPAYDGDDNTFISVPMFFHDPLLARIYSSPAAAERAMHKIERRTLGAAVVVPLTEVCS